MSRLPKNAKILEYKIVDALGDTQRLLFARESGE